MKYHKPFVDALANIQRSRVVEGKTVPAFINTRSNDGYRFLNLEVYADGAVDYGLDELIDLKLFLQKLEQGWITTQIPDGEIIVAGRLGELKISKGRWIYDSKAFYKYAISIIKELNPTYQNLFNNKEEKNIAIRLDPNAYSSLYRDEKYVPSYPSNDTYAPDRYRGKLIHAFYKSEVDVVNLVNLIIFLDRKVVISGLAKPITTDLNGLEKLVEHQKIISELPRNTEVTIYGLGSFIAEQVESVPAKEILPEAYDVYSSLNNKPLPFHCELAYRDYRLTPTIATRDKLRQIYEKLPNYIIEELIYSRNTDHVSIRMILYGDQEIEKWPYYFALKEQGLELPNIVVPKPIDE